MAQTPCYSGSDVLFECGGAYAGACNTTSGSCVCNDGWSGHSDIVPLDTTSFGGRVLSCPVHVATIKVLWALVLLPMASCVYMYPSSFKTAWTIFLRKRGDDRLQYMIISVGMVVMPAYFVTGLALVVLKLADHGGTALVGVHVVPTFLCALNTFCFCGMGLNQFLSSLKGAIAGAVHLPSPRSSTAGHQAGGGDRRDQSKKTLRQLFAVIIGVFVPCMFQDAPLLISAVAYPSHTPVDGEPLDAKRVAAAVWVCAQLLGVFAAVVASWYTQRIVADFFKPILQFSTRSMDDQKRLRATTLRDTSVEAHRGAVRVFSILLLVGLVVRVPTPWWTATQTYWLPIAKLFQARNVYKNMRILTTKRVGVSDAVGRVRTMANRRQHTTGSTRPDTAGGDLVSIAPTAAEKVGNASDASSSGVLNSPRKLPMTKRTSTSGSAWSEASTYREPSRVRTESADGHHTKTSNTSADEDAKSKVEEEASKQAEAVWSEHYAAKSPPRAPKRSFLAAQTQLKELHKMIDPAS